MAEVKWTPAQRSAIEGSGGSLLISAAAGSGKTAVLAQRVMHHITNKEHPVDADKLLVVTFSNAAAGEMKQRISRKLWELTEQHPGDRWLMRQQLLLDCAQISTIHSFCIRLLRGNFHILELPADFRIGDERELDVLRMQTARSVIVERYETGTPVFFDLVELLSSSRNDTRMEAAVLRLYGFVRNHPFYEEWLHKVLSSYSDEQPLEQTSWFSIIMDYATDAIEHCHSILTTALSRMQQDERLYNAYSGAFINDLAHITRCKTVFEGRNWDACRAAVGDITFGSLGRLAGYEDEARKVQFQDIRKEVKGIVKNLQDKLLFLSAEDYQNDMRSLAPVVSELFDITMEFDRKLSDAKLQKKMLDFGDLEHYTLRLLYDTKDGQHTVSALAKELREQYHEILIDEYQDTNGTQEMIFRALSKEDGNRFLVGDVKQSIYRFRQARPENFLEKKENFAPFDGTTFPAKISLSANFRTRSETTGLINFLFGMVMSKKIGEMTYAEEDALYSAGSYDYTETIPVELLVTDPALAPDEDSGSLEARIVAAEIRKLLDARIPVEGKAGKREIQAGDICILLRSPKNKAQNYMAALDKQGIRCWSDRQEGFLTSNEVAPVVSFLKVLANPLLDLELSQVLCSYLYGFSSDDLAQLRLTKGESLFASLLQKAESDPKCSAVVEDFHLLRHEAMSRPASGVLQLIYAVTGAEHKVLAMVQGEARRGNLRLLSEYAASYGGGGDFGGFVDYLYSLEEFECDLPSASIAAGNAVSIMSIHKSKGLEFPVVFLCDTTAQFNTMDLVSDVLMHPELGFACVVRDNRRMTQHRTIPLTAMALENKRAMLSEELRILYVAMTRARERLYITATDKNLGKLQSAAAAPVNGDKLTGWTARSAGCYFDWIAAALCRHPDFPMDILDMPIIPVARGEGQGVLSVRVVLPTKETDDLSEHATGGAAPSARAVEALRKRMHWEYPFTKDTVTPVKLSVSQLTKGVDKKDYFFTRRPRLLTEQSLTPAERGIAAHKFMQFADFDRAAVDPEQEIALLVQKGFLSPEEGQFVERDTLRRFFESELGRRVLSADSIYREIRFMQEFTPAEMADINPAFALEGNTVVQGVADCVIIEQEKGIIIDYKTDRVTSLATLAERYTPQLGLYQRILEQLLEVTISERILYSFALGQWIEV
ncbi:MAG: helicase-exonuclease AddAB subunit AddA [Angelakisella sp.]